MKITPTFMVLFIVIISNITVGQTSNTFFPDIPNYSPLFGKDIILDDKPEQNQVGLAHCSAPNGWLYAAYSHNNPGTYHSRSYVRSKDNGLTWENIRESSFSTLDMRIPKFDLLVSGSDTSDMKLFVAWLYSWEGFDLYRPLLTRYNAITGEVDEGLCDGGQNSHSDIAIASDYLFPAVGSSPFSLACCYIKTGIYGSDSLFIETSSDGGITFSNRILIDVNPAGAAFKTTHLSLSYGYCPSKNSGKYFVAWEKENVTNPSIKQIYTAHSEPYFNSPFTAPVRLDVIDPTAENNCSNPVIACQYDDIDNDSSDLTSVILYQKYIPAQNKYEIAGCYNLQAATTSYFKPINLTGSSHNEIEPDIAYNPYNGEFMATYFDSTSKTLPYLTQGLNFPSPNTWLTASSGYNDSINLIIPNPKVEVSNTEHDATFSWCSAREDGNGIAMFDAVFSTYTNDFTNDNKGNPLHVSIHPNPASSVATIQFNHPIIDNLTLIITDILGKQVMYQPNQPLQMGANTITLDVTHLPNGVYYVLITLGNQTSTCKLIINHP